MSDALLENVSALAGQMQGLARQAHAGYAASYVHTSCEMLDSEGDSAGESTVKERVKYATKKRTGRKPDGRVSA